MRHWHGPCLPCPCRGSGAAAAAAATQAHTWEETTKPPSTLGISGSQEAAVPSRPGLPAAVQGSQWCRAGKRPCSYAVLPSASSPPSETRATAGPGQCHSLTLLVQLELAIDCTGLRALTEPSAVPAQMERINSHPSSMETGETSIRKLTGAFVHKLFHPLTLIFILQHCACLLLTLGVSSFSVLGTSSTSCRKTRERMILKQSSALEMKLVKKREKERGLIFLEVSLWNKMVLSLGWYCLIMCFTVYSAPVLCLLSFVPTYPWWFETGRIF